MESKQRKTAHIVLCLISGDQVDEQLLDVPVEHATEVRLDVEVHKADVLVCTVGGVVRERFAAEKGKKLRKDAKECPTHTITFDASMLVTVLKSLISVVQNAANVTAAITDTQ